MVESEPEAKEQEQQKLLLWVRPIAFQGAQLLLLISVGEGKC